MPISSQFSNAHSNQVNVWIAPKPYFGEIRESVRRLTKEIQKLTEEVEDLTQLVKASLAKTHFEPRRRFERRNPELYLRVYQVLIKGAVDRINTNHERTAKREISILASKVFSFIIGFFVVLKNLVLSTQLFHQNKTENYYVNNIGNSQSLAPLTT